MTFKIKRYLLEKSHDIWHKKLPQKWPPKGLNSEKIAKQHSTLFWPTGCHFVAIFYAKKDGTFPESIFSFEKPNRTVPLFLHCEIMSKQCIVFSPQWFLGGHFLVPKIIGLFL